jgi:Cof subfamily protein (haloacid dehalogenase superfamily)
MTEPAHALDLRLVVADLDGTLLDADGALPDGFWPLWEELRERGIAFAPASGRQYATLRRLFDRAASDLVFIAENGAFVVRGDEEISSSPLDRAFTASVIDRVRALAQDGADVGLVVCGARTAFVERGDEAFLEEARRYYASLELVDDLRAVGTDAVKLAVFDFGRAEDVTAPALAEFGADHQVVVSGEHWIDLMNDGVDKGRAVRALQDSLGVTPAQTVAFGDYLNDLPMLAAAEHSYAMADAHPDVAARARHRAPSHRDGGVVTVLRDLLAR